MADYPDFSSALKKISEYEQSTQLSDGKKANLTDIKSRVQRLSAQVERLMTINNKMISAEGATLHFDSDTGRITFGWSGASVSFTINRADPNVPVKILGQTLSGGYDASKDDPRGDANLEELRRRLEDEIEAFYAQAHRVQKRVQFFFKLKKCACKEIAIVRNHLLEHPINSVTNTFGYGTNGPILSLMMRGQSEFHDKGLLYNAKAFESFLVGVFEKARPTP
jgi:hypothetical protein